MTDKQIIIDGVDISKCKHYDEVFNYCDQSYLGEGGLLKNTKNPKRCECSPNCYYKRLKRKEQECEELHSRTASIIYNLTGGRLSYSTYTLEGCEQAYHDQLEIDIERATKELEEKLQAKEQECEKLKQTLAEIKEIAKKDFNHTCWEIYDRQLKQILQKISECKGEYNEKIR